MEALIAATVSALLMAEVLVLTPMVPGGPIEKRSFAHLPNAVFWGFNLFLISLGMASVAVAVVVLWGASWAFAAAVGLGGCYLAVFGLDLAGVFPKSPDEMSPTLLLLEVADLAIAGALIVVALQGLRM